MSENKYKRAARWLRDVFEGSEKLGPGMVESAALLDLAAQLPEGEAERVLRSAVERKTYRFCDFEDCTIDPMEGRVFCEHHQREVDGS